MLHFKQVIPSFKECFSAFDIPAEKVLFFDIETTGFSPECSYVYLIGCAFLHAETVVLRQWFLNDISEERALVQEFGEFSNNFQLLVHYNGTTFDLPYLQKKARYYGFAEKYFSREILQKKESRQQIDLYRVLSPYKKILNLENMKQKVVEQFLGIKRRDTLTGSDLLPVYTAFVGRYRYESIMRDSPSPKENLPTLNFCDAGLKRMPEISAELLLSALLLHNREDIMGLISISDLFALPRLFEGDFTIEKLDYEYLNPIEKSDLSGGYPTGKSPCLCKFRLNTKLNAALFSSCFSAPITRQISTDIADKISLSSDQTLANSSLSLILTIPVISGTLKYFFENYRDYYYLPMEDYAIHKSIAQFIEKAYRKKATKETCYQKKEGDFLPQPEEFITPALRLHAKDHISFFEYDTLSSLAPDRLKDWVRMLLRWLFELPGAVR